jgi:predicted transposase YbfD/YdcC
VKDWNKAHGRIEIRTIQVSSELDGYVTFPHAKQVFRIHRKAIHIKSGKITEETVCGVTSLTREQASPERLLALVRGHWHIENKLHYVRDVTYDEDRSQVRTGNGPRVMCSLRNLAIMLIRSRGWPGIPSGLRYYSAHPRQVLALIGA